MGDAYVGGPAAAVGIALNATAATGGMHLMLARLPNCFTIGALLTCECLRWVHGASSQYKLLV